MAIPGTEAAEKIENLVGFRDGVADVSQLISKAIELGAVILDGEVALLNAAKLSLQKNGALEFVVAEVALDVGPEGERRDAGLVDEVEDGLGDGGVDPVDEATVDLTPFGGVLDHRRGVADMVVEAELAEHRIEEAAPLAVVGGMKVEENGDMGTDVHRLKDGGGRWLGRSIVREVVGGSRGISLRVSHGSGSGGERIGQGRSVGLLIP